MRRGVRFSVAMLALASASCSIILPLGSEYTFGTDAGQADGGLQDGGRRQDAGDPGPDAGCAVTCDGECTDTNSDPLHCGSCTRSCSAPENGIATCEGGSCGFTCEPGYARVVGTCVARTAPRPIAPLSTSTATSRQPTFRWELAARSDGARIEICEDRACSVVLHTIDAAGASGAPPADLPTGVVFWRLFARMGEDVGTSPSPTWQLYVGARSASVDTSWGTKLDINGDGFADVAVGANDAGSAGRAHLYLGGPAGLSTDPDVTLEAPEGTDARFGSSVASAGDVDGDGFGDLLVAANPDNGSLAGQVYLYRGSPTGISGTPNVQFEAPDGVGSDFGSAISSAGDVDADGFADLVVGAVRVAGEGRAYVYRGGPSGPRATPDVTLIAPDGEPDGLFGNAVASAGDTNGDGFAEIIVGAPGGAGLEGRAYLYNGSASGVPETPTTTLDGVDGMFALFGVALACAGDVNGDGFADIVVGANGASSFEGRVHIYSGTPSGVSAAPSDTIVAPDGGEFGIALSGAGDLDGDGFADVVVGAYRVDSAYVYRGALTGLSTTADFALSAPAGMDSNFGRSVGGGGDVDGDGYPDLIVGASGASSWTGETYVYRGGPSGVTTSPAITLVGPDGEGSSFGSSVAATGTVGTPTWNRAAIASSEGANRADGLLCTHSGELTIDHQHSAPLYWEVSAHVGTHYPVLEPPWRVPPAHSDT